MATPRHACWSSRLHFRVTTEPGACRQDVRRYAWEPGTWARPRAGSRPRAPRLRQAVRHAGRCGPPHGRRGPGHRQALRQELRQAGDPRPFKGRAACQGQAGLHRARLHCARLHRGSPRAASPSQPGHGSPAPVRPAPAPLGIPLPLVPPLPLRHLVPQQGPSWPAAPPQSGRAARQSPGHAARPTASPAAATWAGLAATSGSCPPRAGSRLPGPG